PSVQWIVLTLVCVGICLCGLVGNGTVLWFLGCKMKQNPFTVYILNLAAADFSLLLLFTLLALTVWIFKELCFYDVKNIISHVFLAFAFLCHFFDLSSLGLLTAISVERCISVLFPLWYRCQRPKHSAGITCGVLWVLAGLLISLTYLSINFAPSSMPACAGAVVAFSLIMALMGFISNLVLFIRLRWGSQRRHPGRLYIAVLLNVIVFFAFGVPFNVEAFLNLTTS
ncbi:PREDICTED: mas-related G-protein coupled receptor member X1-like, partial [Merops nubicus]|uniref:mas-related G-protein coupled receptor member X1-like n=1 Tax=Merops nubicus TaxID=57421 RepID=UPI0004F0A8DF